MYKKLVSLVLVLAFVGIASADIQWKGGQLVRNWNVGTAIGTNWDQARIPAATDSLVKLPA